MISKLQKINQIISSLISEFKTLKKQEETPQNNMKILIVTPSLRSIGSGAARYVWELSEYLSSEGVHVTLASNYANRKFYDSRKNLNVIDLGEEGKEPQTVKFWFNLKKIINRVDNLVEEVKPDLLLFMNFPSTLWVKKYNNIPILCHPHDVNMLYTNTYIKNLPKYKNILWRILRLFIRPYEKKKWECFDEVICNSRFSEEHISKLYKVKTSVIHIGSNTDVFHPSSLPKKKAILSIAAQKAQRSDFLIKAACILYQKRKDFKIWIVGSKDTHDKELRDLVKKFNLTEVVEFFGRVSDADLVKLYSESLAIAHLVKIPPFGMIVTEAMACNTPVIACKPGGTEETIVHGETGFLIEENDMESLISYIEKFLDEPNLSLEMGKKGRKRTQEYFEMRKQNEKMKKLMQEWIKKKYQT